MFVLLALGRWVPAALASHPSLYVELRTTSDPFPIKGRITTVVQRLSLSLDVPAHMYTCVVPEPYQKISGFNKAEVSCILFP